MKLSIIPVAILIGFILVGVTSAVPATVNTTRVYILDESGTTPFNVWAGAILLGLALIIISFVHFPHGEEGLISIMAWIPIAFSMFTSFAVETVSGTGVGAGLAGSTDITSVEVHTVHHFDVPAILLLIMLAFAIGNTYRIYANMKAMKEMSQAEESWHDRHPTVGRFED